MIQMLVIYLLFAGIGLSIWHSYRSMRRARRPGATVNEILEGRREKGLLLLGLSVAAAYALCILFISIFWPGLAFWIVLTPLIYLVAWSIPRLFLNDSD